MADIFISYKREDQEEHGRVRPIAEALRAEGYDVFYDVQVPPGSSWEDVLQSKINAARAVIVLWSRHSVDSDWVKEEAEMAKHAGKLIPVFLDAVPPPFGFARIEGANLVDWDGDLSHIEWKNLVAAIKARIGDGEVAAQPGVARVAYQPSKTVTVTKTAPKSGGGGMFKVLAAVLSLAVIGGGAFWAYTQFGASDRRETMATEATIDAVDVATERGRETPSGSNTGTATVNPAIREAVEGRDFTARAPEAVELSPALREAIADGRFTATPADLGESCRNYGTDWEIRQEQGRWKLWGSNRRTVIEFPSQNEAEQGLAILTKYAVDHYCTVSSELHYFKVGDALPTGTLGNEDCTPIQRDRLGYKVVGGRHLVMNGDSSMVTMRTEAEASKALTILRGLGATEMCYLGGRYSPSIMYLKR
ncbi:MAG: TIR domain-containing protein [Pseudomonadota bacterium]